MAKKEKKEKGFMESVHDGYIRGSMGGEEETSQGKNSHLAGTLTG